MIKVIIFDLDGTLYKSKEIAEKFARAAHYTLSKFKNIPLDDARKLIEEKRQEMEKEYSDSVPQTLILNSFGISTESWHKENIDFFDPRDYLTKDEKLKKSLDGLKKRYRLTVLTNNNKIQTERTLAALGLNALFDRVYTYNSFKLLKPNPEFFQKAVEDLNVEPEACFFIGDRNSVDLEPAKKLGMFTYKVKGPEDIYDLLIE
jgi:putative hydrolase of the HAD superfamily